MTFVMHLHSLSVFLKLSLLLCFMRTGVKFRAEKQLVAESLAKPLISEIFLQGSFLIFPPTQNLILEFSVPNATVFQCSTTFSLSCTFQILMYIQLIEILRLGRKGTTSRTVKTKLYIVNSTNVLKKRERKKNYFM